MAFVNHHHLSFISGFVLLMHALFIAWLLLVNPLSQAKVKSKPLLVQTISLKAISSKTQPTPPQRAQPSSPTKEKPTEIKPSATPKKAEDKKNFLPNKPELKESKKTVTNPQLERQQALLAKAQQSIGKMDDHSVKLADKNEFAIPEKIASLAVDSMLVATSRALAEKDQSYRETLAAYLKQQLRLPEFGEINIRLTLKRDGTVAKIEILSADNAVNKHYVEKTLAKLKMPLFGKSFANENEVTFTLTMKGE